MEHYHDQIPMYVIGRLDQAERSKLERHLSDCPSCREELRLWQAVSGEIKAETESNPAPADLADRALIRIHTREESGKATSSRLISACLRVINLLRAQVYMIKRELWPASAGVMALGVTLALISVHAEAVSFLIPMVAAASMAFLYGPEHDPAYELAESTPTSAWKILLARLSVVSVFNLVLALLASLAMLLIVPPELLGMIILGWLAPMAFLSALALLLSLWMKTGNAIMVAYGLWILQYLRISYLLESWGISVNYDAFLEVYRHFWQSPELLLILSFVLLGAALLSLRFSERSYSQTPA